MAAIQDGPAPDAIPLETRFLRLLKSALLNDIYIENEVRFLYLFSTFAGGGRFDDDVFRNIAARMPDWVGAVREARKEGRIWWRVNMADAQGKPAVMDFRNVCEFSHTMIGRKRVDNIEACLDAIRADAIPGDLAETGVWRGGAAIFMKGYLETYAMGDRKVWVADSFEGLPVPSLPQDNDHDFSAAKAPILAIGLDEVMENFRRYDLLDDGVKFLKGWFKDTLHAAPIKELALLRLDGDLYESTMDALQALYAKVVPGGFVIVDDYGDFEPCRRAIDEFRATHAIRDPIVPVDWTGVYWRKTD
ncbi:MAG: class I SAM-dependent methyltransferase [Rhodospirillales bacterium]|nr:class I SAM-dependent methyltransferase [Rhodospirillales bacterium]